MNTYDKLFPKCHMLKCSECYLLLIPVHIKNISVESSPAFIFKLPLYHLRNFKLSGKPHLLSYFYFRQFLLLE